MYTSTPSMPPFRAKPFTRSAPPQKDEKQPISGSVATRLNSRVLTLTKTQNQNVKSRFAQEESRKPDYGRRYKCEQGGFKNGGNSGVKKAQLHSDDVTLIKHLLVLNKKQEMMLNKRLAKLMEEEEFQAFDKAKNDNFNNTRSMSTLKALHLVSDMETQTTHEDIMPVKSIASGTVKKEFEERKILITKKPSYDIHGRRVYVIDTDKESTGDSDNATSDPIMRPSVTGMLKNTKNKTFIKTSALAKNNSTSKPTAIFTNQASPVKRQTFIRKKIGKESGDSVKYESDKFKTDSASENRSKQAASSGDGVEIQNVIVCCSPPSYTDKPKSRNTKVWDYKSLTSVKSGESEAKDRADYTIETLLSVGTLKNSEESIICKEIDVTPRTRVSGNNPRKLNPNETVFYRKKIVR